MRLGLAIGMALAIGAAHAEFPSELELSALNGTNGFALNGVAAADHSGRSVSAVGDVNGDGIDDLIIGAPDADPNALFAGASYVVFGTAQGFSTPLNLSTLNGSNGFVINGEGKFDGAGTSVRAAGDFNGDGIADLVVGAPDASTNADFSGSTYVVFGRAQGFSSPLELSDINGSNGIVINGATENDASGTSVSGAGDINADGIDDLIIGAPFAGAGAGVSYVVFGSDQGFTSPLNISTPLNGSNGFAINGVQSGDSSGMSVSAAGDINGDDIDDLIIGAPEAGPIGSSPGAGYVVFGHDGPWASSLNLSTLNGSNGFTINGVDVGDKFGTSVSAAGDINGDGIDDVVLGAPQADPNGAASGASYVLFGSEAWPSAVNLSGLTGGSGFVINGVSASDESGTAVRAAGDINADGVDDLVLGAPLADPNGSASGASYVVFGSADAWAASLNLSGLNGANGFRVKGVAADNRSGRSVSAAGDINADGLADLVIGAPGDPLGTSAGASYVIFGTSGASEDLIFADGFE